MTNDEGARAVMRADWLESNVLVWGKRIRIVLATMAIKPLARHAVCVHAFRHDLVDCSLRTQAGCRIEFTISDSGARKLGEYLRQPNAREMVVFIDGHAYASITLDLAREMVQRRVLWVIPPHPQQSITYRFLRLLMDKLRARMAEQ